MNGNVRIRLPADSRRQLQNYERPQIRLPPVAEKPRLHRRGGADARARDRGEHDDFQRRQRRAVTSLAVRRGRAAGVAKEDGKATIKSKVSLQRISSTIVSRARASPTWLPRYPKRCRSTSRVVANPN